MKATGIVRRVDDLGRIVIPKELRSKLGISDGTPLEIFTTDGGIEFRPYHPGCICCEEIHGLVEYNGVCLCKSCLDKFKKAVL